MKPTVDEPVCPISYAVTCILVNGTPENRSGFWRKYRENLSHNRRTRYQNSRVEICADQLRALKIDTRETYFYRDEKLVAIRASREVSD